MRGAGPDTQHAVIRFEIYRRVAWYVVRSRTECGFYVGDVLAISQANSWMESPSWLRINDVTSVGV